MPQQSRAKKSRSAKAFARAIAQGKTQTEAYSIAFPNASRVTANGNSSRYANNPQVRAYIEEALAKITEEDAGDVVRKVVQTAKQKGGDIDKNRDMFFKLAGHPAFNKQVNVSVGASVEVPDGLLEAMGKMLDRLDGMLARSGGDSVEKDADFIDVDYTPDDDGRTESD